MDWNDEPTKISKNFDNSKEYYKDLYEQLKYYLFQYTKDPKKKIVQNELMSNLYQDSKNKFKNFQQKEKSQKSGYNNNNILNDSEQIINNIFLHKLRGLHIVYNSLRVINPVRKTATNLYVPNCLLNILHIIIIIKIFKATTKPLDIAFLNTLIKKFFSDLL